MNPFHKCRLCLKLGEFCSIFEQDDTLKLSDMVMAFSNIQIRQGDGLPDRVCADCVENLSTAYLFKQQCERIDSILRKTPDTDLIKPSMANYEDFFNKEFHMHAEFDDSAEGDNDQNCLRDSHNENISMNNNAGTRHEISDETDSDMDSVKCVCCNESYSTVGPHTCRVQCTIEHNQLQRSSSNETLVASDMSPIIQTMRPVPPVPERPVPVFVSCLLCDDKYDQYEDYVLHLNKCTTNVKLHHFVCPVCHEMFVNKLDYLDHLKVAHFKIALVVPPGTDCVDAVPLTIIEKTRRPKAVRRQIGWSVEDIYQEIDCKKIDDKRSEASSPSNTYFQKETPTSSPIKNFFSKLGNESFSRQSTPKRVSFRKFIENGKAKTAVYLPFQKLVQNYKQKKKNNGYSPIQNKMQITTKVRASLPAEALTDSDYNSPSGTSEESWRLKQNLICACDKKIFMLSEFIHLITLTANETTLAASIGVCSFHLFLTLKDAHTVSDKEYVGQIGRQDRDRITAMINELGGVVAENTKMEMLATHFISVLPQDTCTGMMVCALATGKWLLTVSFVYDSFRCKKFLQEYLYEWMKHPKILEMDNTSVEVSRTAVFWHNELAAPDAKLPFEGKQVVLIMKKKYRQYYHMIFKALKAKPVTYDPRTPGSCCTADYCFVDMKVIERVKLRFFARHNVPVFPYQYILVYLLKRGRVEDEQKYLLQDCKMYAMDNNYLLNNTC